MSVLRVEYGFKATKVTAKRCSKRLEFLQRCQNILFLGRQLYALFLGRQLVSLSLKRIKDHNAAACTQCVHHLCASHLSGSCSNRTGVNFYYKLLSDSSFSECF